MESERPPLPVQQLQETLAAAGLRLIEDGYFPRHFGNRLLVFKGEAICVRVVKDRGQWAVEVSGPSCTDYYAPADWRSYLDDQISGAGLPTLEEDCAIVADRLGDMQASADQNQDLAHQLRQVSIDRYRLRQRRQP
jgi:hypothetical protein